MKSSEHVSLASLSSMKVGGTVRYFLELERKEELPSAILFARTHNLPVAIIGEGSNTLPLDIDYDLVLIKILDNTVTFSPHEEGVEVVASAGCSWDALVEKTIEMGYRGLENLSAVPGTVGAAPIQNIGAYGVEVENFIQWVEVFDTKSMSQKKIQHSECGFSYRDSLFKRETHLIVTSVSFFLRKNALPNISYQDLKYWFCEKHHMNPSAKEVREAVIAIRAKKFPDRTLYGTLGSFFQNPIVDKTTAVRLAQSFPGIPLHLWGESHLKTSAAWLIDHVAEYKGVRVGDVGTWPSQALVLVNYGKATEQEISKFAQTIVDLVKQKTGIVLVREVVPLSFIK